MRVAGKFIFRIALLCFFLLIVSASFAIADDPKCDFRKGPCIRKVDSLEVMFDIAPKPVKAMDELFFSVTISGAAYNAGDKIIMDLSMPGMFMGINKVILTKGPDGRYTGKGIIPRCHSGKNSWSAAVSLPGKGKIDFLFDVVY